MGDGGGKVIKSSKRPRFKGRSERGPTFIMLRHDVVRSDQYRALSFSARSLMVFFADQYNGRNNGDLSMGKADLDIAGWRQATALAARDELVASGFLICTRHSIGRRVALYALTTYSIDECPGQGLEVPSTRTPPDSWKGAVALRKPERKEKAAAA